MPPLEDVQTQVSLASGTDVEITQDQAVPNEILTQELHKHLLEQLN